MTEPPYTCRPLLNELRVHVVGEHVAPDLLLRFSNVFAAVWARLPAGVRDAIIEHWRPAIEILPTFAPVRLLGSRAGFRGSRKASAYVTEAGFSMVFDGQHFAGEFGPFAAETIAHELGHVYQHACGRRGEFLTSAESEADVARLQQEWGFWFGPRGGASDAYAANANAAALEGYSS